MPSHETRSYDIVVISDLRFPGGTSASISEEIKAQASAGYTTGLLHLPTTLRRRPYNLGIRRCIDEGLADLIVGDQPVRARLLMVRHPLVIERMNRTLPPIEADVKLLVVNQVPLDAQTGEPFYDVDTVLANLDRVVGPGVTWAPIGPLVRQSLDPFPQIPSVTAEDWINVIDLDEWSVDRSSFVAAVPVIGRHSRPDFKKWPDNAADLLAAYPDDDRYRVRILGGADAAEEILGYRPGSWSVIPFNGMASRAFLAQIDFYVYFHHPKLVEAFGRGILEALASGAVAIVPHRYEALFGDACLYAEPSDVRAIVDRLYADKAAYDAQAARGQAFVRRDYAHDTHVRRVADLIGPPSGARRAYQRIGPPSEHRILFVGDDGADPGSLARLVAMAGRLSPRRQPIFLTLSPDVSSIRQAGWPAEYFDQRGGAEIRARRPNRALLDRLSAIVETHEPSVVVFDGTSPPEGVRALRGRYPQLPLVWCKPGSNKPDDHTGSFDLVLPAGDGGGESVARIEQLLKPAFG